MKRHPLHIKSEQGAATLVVAIAVAGALSAAVYYNFDKLGNMRKEVSAMLERDRSQQANISGLSQASALMAYQGTAPRSDDPNALPFIYPEPYIGNGSVVAIQRNPSSASTWSISKAGDTLTLKTPGSKNLHAKDFDDFAEKNERPALDSSVQLNSKDRIKHATNPNWIVAMTADATVVGKDNQKTTSEATIPVPRMPAPRCRLVSSSGAQVFQPNSQVGLDLYVYGVAEGAYYPVEAYDLVAGSPDDARVNFNALTYVDLKDVANRVSNIYSSSKSKVFSFSVTTPRPLYAVDGSGVSVYYAIVRLKAVDDSDPREATCNIALPVEAAASCKLFTSKSSLVGDGDCTTITAGSIGSANMSTLQVNAYDEGGHAYPSSIKKTGNNTFEFCAPKKLASASATVSKDEESEFDKEIKNLSTNEKSSVSNTMQTHSDMLKSIFKREAQKPLLNLTIAQVAGLIELPYEKMKSLDYDQFTKDYGRTNGIRGFKSPDADLISKDNLNNLIKALTTEMSEAEFNDLKLYSLDTVPALSKVAKPKLETIETYPHDSLVAYIEQQLESSSLPRTYKIEGTVSSANGGKNTCLVHVNAGSNANSCAYLGKNYPKIGKEIPWYINYYGNAWTASLNFNPGAPNWEVDAIPNSPTDVTPCPPGARCYAINAGGTNRMPFVMLHDSESSSCYPVAATRINLGCFAYGTKIRMADGKDKSIELVKIGDKVLNPIKNIAMAVKRTTAGPEKHDLIVIKTGNDTVKVTNAHPMITRSGVVAASEIKVGDEIKGINNSYVKVEGLSKEAPTGFVLNLELDTPSTSADDHAVLADGVVTGDLYLQEKLAKEMPKI